MCWILRSFICKTHWWGGHGTCQISYQSVPHELIRKGFLIRRWDNQKNLCLSEPSFTRSYCRAEYPCQVFFSEGCVCRINVFEIWPQHRTETWLQQQQKPAKALLQGSTSPFQAASTARRNTRRGSPDRWKRTTHSEWENQTLIGL